MNGQPGIERNTMEDITFKLKVTQKEAEQFILKMLEADNQINQREAKFFREMSKHGNSFFMEFVIPMGEAKMPKKESVKSVVLSDIQTI